MRLSCSHTFGSSVERTGVRGVTEKVSEAWWSCGLLAGPAHGMRNAGQQPRWKAILAPQAHHKHGCNLSLYHLGLQACMKTLHLCPNFCVNANYEDSNVQIVSLGGKKTSLQVQYLQFVALSCKCIKPFRPSRGMKWRLKTHRSPIMGSILPTQWFSEILHYYLTISKF